MKTIEIQAKLADDQIHEELSKLDDPWEMKTASAWVPSPETGEFIKVVERGDVYELLDSEVLVKFIKMTKIVTILTIGWAAPFNNDDDEDGQVAPSQHDKRRRVRLTVTATPTKVATVLRFKDTPDDIISDQGSGRGSLADAVTALMARVSADSN